MNRLLKYPLQNILYVIDCSVAYEENRQHIYFQEEKGESIINKNVKTSLTAYFELNETDVETRKYLCSDIPVHLTFDKEMQKYFERNKTK